MKSNANLEQYSEQILRENDLLSAPVDITKLIKKMGVIKHDHVLEPDVWGMAVTEGTQKIISINTNQSETRKRFTMAHELAHIIFDTEIAINVDKKVYYRNGLSDWREKRANFFASCILIPQCLLIPELKKISPTGSISEEEIDSLAKKFKVSPQAMCIRLERLGQLV